VANSLIGGILIIKSDRRKIGFSLIELLVVIGIIALLMAVLLPSLQLAKAQGRGVVCRSNIRQLALANIAYAVGNNDCFVPAASDMWSTCGGLKRWHGVRKTPVDAFDPLEGPLVSYLGGGKIKECPEKYDYFQGTTWSESFEKGGGGFGYNMYYIGSGHWRGEQKTFEAGKEAYVRTTRIAEVSRASETLMFADTAFLQGNKMIEYSFAEPRHPFVYGILRTNRKSVPSIHFRHNERANIGWVDGHVTTERLPREYSAADSDLEGYREHLLGLIKPSGSIGQPLGNRLFDLK